MNNNIFYALRERAFLFLWLGEIFTQVSINLFSFFVILSVFTLTKSNTAVSGVVLTITIPAVLIGILAGVYVDQWEKKKVLYTVNILRAFLVLFLAFFHTNIILIYTITTIISFLTQFFIPAESPIIPHIVKPQLLLSANALFGLAIYGSILIAYVMSGPLLIAFGQVNTLLIISLLLFIGAFFLSFIQIPEGKIISDPNKNKNTKIAAISEIRKAFKVMSANKDIHHSLFLLALSQILILIIATIAPGYANQVLGIQVEQFPLLFVAPAALGVIVGAVLIGNVFGKTPKNRIINTGLFLSGVAMLTLPFGSRIASRAIIHTLNIYLPHIIDITVNHIVVVIAFLLGFANAFVFVPANTILLENTEDSFRGKVYGVLNTLVGLFSLLPIIIVGGLSDLIGVSSVIIGIGVILIGLWLSRLFKIL